MVIDPRRQQLIGIRTATASREPLTSAIRAVGTVQLHPRRGCPRSISSSMAGFARLFVDYTGQPIAKGQPLFTFYSPDLLATGKRDLLALKTRNQLQNSRFLTPESEPTSSSRRPDSVSPCGTCLKANSVRSKTIIARATS